MTVKTIILKTGENLISDIKEGFLGEKLVCYILENPCVIKINGAFKVVEDDRSEGAEKISVTFQPWPLFTKDSKIEISCDSVMTITNPTEEIKILYQNQISNETNETSQNSISNQQSNSDQSD